MSWIKTKTEDAQADAPKVASEPNYNRDMNSPPLPQRSASTKVPAGNATLGESIRIEGTLTGNEDLAIHGTVKGQVNLNGHSLTVGPKGKIEAALSAKSVTVEGKVSGDISANDKIRIAPGGSVDGNLQAPRIALDEGGHFKGRVEMDTEKK